MTSPASPLCDQFAISGGSVVGREHRRLYRDNQDGFAYSAEPEHLVAVVTDGCSSSRHSEVGARLAARWLANWLPRYIDRCGAGYSGLVERATAGLLCYLDLCCSRLAPHSGGERESLAVLRDFALFGFLAAVVGRRETIIFGVGDGLFAVDGATTVIDPGPDNAPPYLAYQLALDATTIDPRCCAPRLHYRGETSKIDSLLLGTDGAIELAAPSSAVGLAQLDHPRYLRNPSLLQKRLFVLGELEGRLSDDTTLVLLRRRDAETGGGR